MNSQEVFDFSARHLIKQGKSAVDLNGHCRYRTDEGLKCAIGCFIPDAKYTPEMDTGNINLDQVLTLADLIPLASEHMLLLRNLQRAHDSNNVDATIWLEKLRVNLKWVASNHNLNTGVLDD